LGRLLLVDGDNVHRASSLSEAGRYCEADPLATSCHDCDTAEKIEKVRDSHLLF